MSAFDTSAIGEPPTPISLIAGARGSLRDGDFSPADTPRDVFAKASLTVTGRVSRRLFDLCPDILGRISTDADGGLGLVGFGTRLDRRQRR